jgi:hypothetical protein
MYITTNSKTIITPNNTPYSSPDLPGDAFFSIELYLLIHKYNNSDILGYKKVLRFNKKKKTKICLLENNRKFAHSK